MRTTKAPCMRKGFTKGKFAASSVCFLLSNTVLAGFVADRLDPETLSNLASTYSDPKQNCAILLENVSRTEFQETVRDLDLKKFSFRTTLAEMDELWRLPPGTIELAGTTNKKFETQFYLWTQPWSASLFPFENIRRFSFDHRSRTISYERLSEQILTKEYQEALAIRRKEVLATRDPPIEIADAKLVVLCGIYGKLRSLNACVKSLRTILVDMLPRGSNLALIEDTFRFLSDPKRLEGIRIAAEKIRDLVQADELPNTRMFSLLENAFLGANFSAKEAYEVAWEFMGIYSASGANISQRIDQLLDKVLKRVSMGSDGNTDIASLFETIALGSSVLDARMWKKADTFFSMPENVASTIENAKPYHFWGAAYHARKNTILHGSPSGASSAAWLAQLGYQMQARTAGRDPERAFKTAAFSVANNKIRLDLAYAANGTEFGSLSISKAAREHFDVDATLRVLLENGENLRAMEQMESVDMSGPGAVRYWTRWRRIFAPESAILYVRRKLGRTAN